MSRLFSDLSVPVWEQSVAQTPEEKAYYQAGLARAVMQNWGYKLEVRRQYGRAARAYRYDPKMELLFVRRMANQHKEIHYAVNHAKADLLEAQRDKDEIACKACLARLEHLTPFVNRFKRPRYPTPVFFKRLRLEQLRSYLAAENQR